MLVPRQSCNRVRRQNSVSFRQGCVSQFGRVVPDGRAIPNRVRSRREDCSLAGWAVTFPATAPPLPGWWRHRTTPGRREGEHLHEARDRGQPRVVVWREIEDGTPRWRAKRCIQTRPVSGFGSAQRRPFNRVDALCKEPARAFLRHMNRDHVHGAVEHACGNLEPPTPIPTAYVFNGRREQPALQT